MDRMPIIMDTNIRTSYLRNSVRNVALRLSEGESLSVDANKFLVKAIKTCDLYQPTKEPL